MTNFEYEMKNMTVEDLAMIMMCPYEGRDGFNSAKCNKNCYYCTIDYLNSEREKD